MPLLARVSSSTQSKLISGLPSFSSVASELRLRLCRIRPPVPDTDGGDGASFGRSPAMSHWGVACACCCLRRLFRSAFPWQEAGELDTWLGVRSSSVASGLAVMRGQHRRLVATCCCPGRRAWVAGRCRATKPTQWPYGARAVLTCPPWVGG